MKLSTPKNETVLLILFTRSIAAKSTDTEIQYKPTKVVASESQKKGYNYLWNDKLKPNFLNLNLGRDS